jgi:hypothetical protein
LAVTKLKHHPSSVTGKTVLERIRIFPVYKKLCIAMQKAENNFNEHIPKGKVEIVI